MLERKFQKDPVLFLQYKFFIETYVGLGHAKEVNVNCCDVYNDT